MTVLPLTLLLFFLLPTGSLGDICEDSCECHPPYDPLDVRCPNASFHIIPQDLPPFIEFLDLKGNSLAVIEPTLNHYERLLSLDLSQNAINTIRPKSFANLKYLNELDLSGNQLSHLGAADLVGLKDLKTLSLKGNQIMELHEKAFSKSCPSLKSLDLSWNHIYTFPTKLFANLKSLKTLDLSHNRLTSLTFLRDLNLPILDFLSLDGNNFASIREQNPFRHLSSLMSLSLSGCRLSNLPRDFFEGLRGLKELDLRDNLIESLPSPSLSNEDLRELAVLQIGSHVFREINSGIGDLEGLRELSISGCIKSLPFKLEQDTFRNNTLLRGLNFTNCPGLEHIPEGTFLDLPHFEYLNLRGNGLTTISPRSADWNSLSSLDLELNPFECDCSMSWILGLPGYDSLRSMLAGSTCRNGKPILQMDVSSCGESPFSTHLLAIILGSTAGVIVLIASIVLGIYIYRQRKNKGSRYHRKKLGKINKHEISVIPRNVTNPAGYKDVIPEEEMIPLGGNLLNFPDVKTCVL